MGKKRSTKQHEVCRQLDIQPYVLRYWETEFPFLKSSKASGAQRSFSAEEVVLLGRIRTLLYDEGYTIAGARKRIEAEESGAATAPQPVPAGSGDPAAAADVPQSRADAVVESATNDEVTRLRSGAADALSMARSTLAMLESS
jgi:DNA-binding transcriptional MerR regulator